MRKAGWIASLCVGVVVFVSPDAHSQPASGPPSQAEVAKLLEDGQEALRSGRFEKAFKAFTKADRLARGTSAAALIGSATVHIQLAQFEEAATQAEKALSVATVPPEQAMAHNLVGSALWGAYKVSSYERSEDPASLLDRAESSFSQALRLSGGQLNIAWSNLALVLEEEGRFTDAETVLQAYLERVPDNRSAQDRLSRVREEREWQEFDELWMGLAREGELAEAVGVIEDYRNRSPGHPRAGTRFCWLRVAGIETRENRYDASKLEFDVDDIRAKANELPLKLMGDVEPPEFLDGPAPTYTDEARIAQIYGKVVLEAVIDKEGNVRCPWILEDLPLGLGDAAVAAVERWRFQPASLDGQPVAVQYEFKIGFDLD